MASGGIVFFGSSIAGSTTTTIADVVGISVSGLTASDIDITSSESSDGFMEFKAGLVDPGEISIDLVYSQATAAALAAAVGTSQTITITFSNGNKFVCTGYIKSVSTTGSLGDKISATATIKITGKPSALWTVS